MPQNIQKAHLFKLGTITFSIDMALYLAAEREKYGDNGNRDYVVVLSQSIVSWILSGAGAAHL